MRISPHRFFGLALIWMLLVSQVPATMAQNATPPAFEASPEASPAAAQSLGNTFAEQRTNAIPFGDQAHVGDLAIVVEEFHDDSSELLNPDYSPRYHRNQRMVNIVLTIANEGVSTYDLASEHYLLIAGNRGFYRWLQPVECSVDNNVRDPESATLEPGEERTFNACGIASTRDIESLQLWFSPPISSTAASELHSSGRWFSLGGNESFDASQIEGQRQRAIDLQSVIAELGAPASPSDSVRAGDLVYELTSFSSDVAGDLSSDEQAQVAVGPGQTLAVATFRITNVGDRLLAPDVRLLDSTGVSPASRSVPVTLDDERGGMLPGGTMERRWMWVVDESEQSSLALRLSHSGTSPATSWMLADTSSDFAWSPDEVELAQTASGAEESPVAFGETASILDFNVSVAEAPSQVGHEIILTNASNDPDGALITAELSSNGRSCAFTEEDQRFYVLSRFTLPGVEMKLGADCGNNLGQSLELTLIDAASNSQSGYFSLPTTSPATPVATPTEQPATPVPSSPTAATPVTTPVETETPATPTADAEDTATVTTAANVRSEPSLSGIIVTVAAEGETVTIMGDGVEADGYIWIPIVTSSGAEGWIAADFLER